MITIELKKYEAIDIFEKDKYVGKLANYKEEVMKLKIRKIAGVYNISLDTDEILMSMWGDKIVVKDMSNEIIETIQA